MKTLNLFLQGLNRDITFNIGENKIDNFNILDISNVDDLWFHSYESSSCYVVAKIPNNIINKEMKYIIKAGAILCKNYTNKLKKLKNVEIIYTQIKNIEKTEYKGCVRAINEKKIIV
jgi:hypothetical protein